MLRHPLHHASGEHGQSSVEYAAVLLFVVIVIVLALASGIDGVLAPVAGKIIGSIS